MRGIPNKRKPGRPKQVQYKRLRARMETLGVSSADVGAVLGIDASPVRKRLAGKTPWALWEAYKVLDLLGLPASDLYLYFPANGEDVESVGQQSVRAYLAETNQSLVADSALDALITLVQGIEQGRTPGRQAK